MALLKDHQFNELCKVLKISGLTPNDPDKKTIEKAFRRLALKTHPDKGGDPIEFKKINEAYNKLIGHVAKLEAIEAEAELSRTSVIIEISTQAVPKWKDKLKASYGPPKTSKVNNTLFNGPYNHYKGKGKLTGPIVLVLYEDPEDKIPKIVCRCDNYMAWIQEQKMPLHLHVGREKKIMFDQWRIMSLAEFGFVSLTPGHSARHDMNNSSASYKTDAERKRQEKEKKEKAEQAAREEAARKAAEEQKKKEEEEAARLAEEERKREEELNKLHQPWWKKYAEKYQGSDLFMSETTPPPEDDAFPQVYSMTSNSYVKTEPSKPKPVPETNGGPNEVKPEPKKVEEEIKPEPKKVEEIKPEPKKVEEVKPEPRKVEEEVKPEAKKVEEEVKPEPEKVKEPERVNEPVEEQKTEVPMPDVQTAKVVPTESAVPPTPEPILPQKEEEKSEEVPVTEAKAESPKKSEKLLKSKIKKIKSKKAVIKKAAKAQELEEKENLEKENLEKASETEIKMEDVKVSTNNRKRPLEDNDVEDKMSQGQQGKRVNDHSNEARGLSSTASAANDVEMMATQQQQLSSPSSSNSTSQSSHNGAEFDQPMDVVVYVPPPSPLPLLPPSPPSEPTANHSMDTNMDECKSGVSQVLESEALTSPDLLKTLKTVKALKKTLLSTFVEEEQTKVDTNSNPDNIIGGQTDSSKVKSVEKEDHGGGDPEQQSDSLTNAESDQGNSSLSQGNMSVNNTDAFKAEETVVREEEEVIQPSAPPEKKVEEAETATTTSAVQEDESNSGQLSSCQERNNYNSLSPSPVVDDASRGHSKNASDPGKLDTTQIDLECKHRADEEHHKDDPCNSQQNPQHHDEQISDTQADINDTIQMPGGQHKPEEDVKKSVSTPRIEEIRKSESKSRPGSPLSSGAPLSATRIEEIRKSESKSRLGSPLSPGSPLGTRRRQKSESLEKAEQWLRDRMDQKSKLSMEKMEEQKADQAVNSLDKASSPSVTVVTKSQIDSDERNLQASEANHDKQDKTKHLLQEDNAVVKEKVSPIVQEKQEINNNEPVKPEEVTPVIQEVKKSEIDYSDPLKLFEKKPKEEPKPVISKEETRPHWFSEEISEPVHEPKPNPSKEKTPNEDNRSTRAFSPVNNTTVPSRFRGMWQYNRGQSVAPSFPDQQGPPRRGSVFEYSRGSSTVASTATSRAASPTQSRATSPTPTGRPQYSSTRTASIVPTHLLRAKSVNSEESLKSSLKSGSNSSSYLDRAKSVHRDDAYSYGSAFNRHEDQSRPPSNQSRRSSKEDINKPPPGATSRRSSKEDIKTNGSYSRRPSRDESDRPRTIKEFSPVILVRPSTFIQAMSTPEQTPPVTAPKNQDKLPSRFRRAMNHPSSNSGGSHSSGMVRSKSIHELNEASLGNKATNLQDQIRQARSDHRKVFDDAQSHTHYSGKSSYNGDSRLQRETNRTSSRTNSDWLSRAPSLRSLRSSPAREYRRL